MTITPMTANLAPNPNLAPKIGAKTHLDHYTCYCHTSLLSLLVTQTITRGESTLTMDLLTQEVLEGPPKKTFCWTPQEILLNNVEGEDPINICDIFKFDTDYGSKVCKDELILPTSLYPPTEDFYEELVEKIKQSVRLSNMQLKCNGTQANCYDKSLLPDL